MKKIVVAPDTFKGSLSAQQVAEAVAEGIHAINPAIEVVLHPVADGGEGTMETLLKACGGRAHQTWAADPLMRKRSATYGIIEREGTKNALIDMATVNGLTLLPPAERNPLNTSSYGTGQLMAAAWEEGCRQFVIGIGGSATSDAGMGMMQALGVRFLDAQGRELTPTGGALEEIAALDLTQARHELLQATCTVLCDVRNPLYGPQGAAHIFSPQKGATPEAVDRLDRGLRQWAKVVEATIGREISTTAGAGAAGGLGAAFLAFFPQAVLQPGIETVLDLTNFDEKIADADLVITGEGSVDQQSCYGKVPMGVLLRSQRQGVPVVVIGGAVSHRERLLQAGFAGIFSITPRPQSLVEAMQPDNAYHNVRTLAMQIVSLLQSKPHPAPLSRH